MGICVPVSLWRFLAGISEQAEPFELALSGKSDEAITKASHHGCHVNIRQIFPTCQCRLPGEAVGKGFFIHARQTF